MLIDASSSDSLTRQIIGCAMEVHKTIGNGSPEVIYQRALAYELQLASLYFKREFDMPIFCKGIHVGTRRVDLLVEDIISVELKVVIMLDRAHLAQAINYLEAYNLKTGLLINFGSPSLTFKRLYNNKHTL